MRAIWSDRPNCSHNVSQKVKRIRRVSEKKARIFVGNIHWKNSLRNLRARLPKFVRPNWTIHSKSGVRNLGTSERPLFSEPDLPAFSAVAAWNVGALLFSPCSHTDAVAHMLRQHRRNN